MFPGSGKVVSGQVGFMGPATAKPNPTYEEVTTKFMIDFVANAFSLLKCILMLCGDFEQVCTGHTRHVEVYNLKFDGDEQTYEDLVKHFFMFHDPTTLNQQGNDIGTQYASAIFCSDQKQVII